MADAAPFPPPDFRTFDGHYLIYRKKGQGFDRSKRGPHMPRFRHPTFEAAETEARRLHGLFPESTFVIVREVARIKRSEVDG